jgi:hypothetical protein
MEEEIVFCLNGNTHDEGQCAECEAQALGWKDYAEQMRNYVGH